MSRRRPKLSEPPKRKPPAAKAPPRPRRSTLFLTLIGLVVGAVFLWFSRGSDSSDKNIITCDDGPRETVEIADFTAEYAPVAAALESRLSESLGGLRRTGPHFSAISERRRRAKPRVSGIPRGEV